MLRTVVCLALVSGCMGQIEGGGEEGNVIDEHDPLMPIDTGMKLDPKPVPPLPPSPAETRSGPTAWKRLGRVQYENTIKELVTWSLQASPGPITSAMYHLKAPLANLPGDLRTPLLPEPRGGFTRLDQDVTQEFVEGTYGVAVVAAAQMAGRMDLVVGKCANDKDTTNDLECLTTFIKRFGERALRRGVTAEDVAYFRGLIGDVTAMSSSRLATLLMGFLTAPEHLYQLELGEAPIAGRKDAFTLSAYELASRLSYQLWNTMPDEALFEAARSGAVLTPEGYRQQLDRLLRDPRARIATREFYRDWLRLDELPDLNALNNDGVREAATFRAFIGDLKMGLSAVRGAMIDDVLAMTEYFSFTRPGGLKELLTSELSFATNPDLAHIYGAPVWQPGAEPPSVPAGTRPGLFTRGAFLATGSLRSRPIMKGVFLREAVLCDQLPPPPADADMDTSKFDADKLTTRQIVETLTEAKGTSCAVCHANLINHLGFPTESYDALGRNISQERLFANGKLQTSLPVNTRAVPQVNPGDTTPVNNASELMQQLLRSQKVAACLARQYFRYTYGRPESSRNDGPALDRLARVVRDGTLADLLRETALAPEFRQRWLGEQEVTR